VARREAEVGLLVGRAVRGDEARRGEALGNHSA
jgi:hypothetical protein